jgi:hypothetical protein
MRIIVPVLLLVFVAGCPRPFTPAVGRLREVTVVSNEWGAVEEAVQEVLQQQIRTPQPEPEFLIRTMTLDQFKVFSGFRTLLIIGTTQDTIIRKMLGGRLDSLPGGESGMFRVPNVWADHQEVVILVAREPGGLEPAVRAYAERLRSTVREAVLKHIARAAYGQGRTKRAEDSLLNQYAFSLDIPKGWFLKQEHADSGFVYLFGHHPDRGLFVYWDEGERELLPESMPGLRDRLTRMYYGGDIIEPGYLELDTIQFLGRPAVRMQGVWQNEESAIGGPFVTYSFNYMGRFFMVDGLVFNPGRKKLDQLFQVEAMVSTFTPQ